MYIFRVPSKSLPLPSLSVFTGKSASSAPSGTSGSDGTDASSSADSDGSSANSEMPTCNSDREDSSSSSDSDRGPGPAGPSVADSLKPAHKAVLQASKDWYRPRSDTKLPKQALGRNAKNKYTRGLSDFAESIASEFDSPLKSVRQVIDDSIVRIMFECTAARMLKDRRSAGALRWDEMWTYLALVTWMGVKSLPRIRDYWRIDCK